jgi:hypothetical protein
MPRSCDFDRRFYLMMLFTDSADTDTDKMLFRSFAVLLKLAWLEVL